MLLFCYYSLLSFIILALWLLLWLLLSFKSLDICLVLLIYVTKYKYPIPCSLSAFLLRRIGWHWCTWLWHDFVDLLWAYYELTVGLTVDLLCTVGLLWTWCHLIISYVHYLVIVLLQSFKLISTFQEPSRYLYFSDSYSAICESSAYSACRS